MLADMLENREKLDKELQGIIDLRTEQWGVNISSVELRDILIPQELQNAMSMQAQAERERQARVILGDSEKQIAQKFEEAARTYQDNPTALHLRAMNMLFEGLKTGNPTIVIVPASVLSTMNLGDTTGVIALAQNLEDQKEKAKPRGKDGEGDGWRIPAPPVIFSLPGGSRRPYKLTTRPDCMETGDIDGIYRRIPLDKIPWNNETPPDALVELVKSGKVKPCRTVDLGCGAGNYAIYLAGMGFDVTGVDGSPTAIAIAREKAEEQGIRCDFIVADLLGDLHEVEGTFDFAYDWEVLHHIFPGDRETYVKNIHKILNPGAEISLGLLQRGGPPVRRHRKVQEDHDRDNTLLLVGIRDPRTLLAVLRHQGITDHKSQRQVRASPCYLCPV